MTEQTSSLQDPMLPKMLLAAQLYYRDKLSQQEIARQLNISRPWVSKLLKRAEDAGIVRIEICPPYSGSDYLAHALQEKYGLLHCAVAPGDDPELAHCAQTAADFFLSSLRPGDTVGVGWGTSVSHLIDHTAQRTLPGVKIVPLAGSFGNTISHFPNFSAMRLAERLGSEACVLHTPALCASAQEYRLLSTGEATRAALQLAEHADILLLGIGALADSVSPQYGVFTPADIAALKAKKAIGDVALQYLDEDGRPVDIETTRRLIKADICKASANARISIGIAAGLPKVHTIDAALKLRLVNALFTNEETALALLDL